MKLKSRFDRASERFSRKALLARSLCREKICKLRRRTNSFREKKISQPMLNIRNFKYSNIERFKKRVARKFKTKRIRKIKIKRRTRSTENSMYGGQCLKD